MTALFAILAGVVILGVVMLSVLWSMDGWNPGLNTSEDGSYTGLFVFKGDLSNDIQAVRRGRCPRAAEREQRTTSRAVSTGLYEKSIPVV